jgi:hypothetical protein
MMSSSQTTPYPAREGKYINYHFEKGSSGLFGLELNDDWKSKKKILRRYRAIRLGYYLLGDDGVLNGWKFRGASRIKSLAHRLLAVLTKAAVPSWYDTWYDTHARHSGARINA